MESSKEQIEAQLCAYIDGELGDAERAEIERHLATNPQHKALIAELRGHSGLLQDLPRASAPLELNEALCGQLERSSLLNPSEEESSRNVLSINRWPQITAVAAVLMLAIGLGIVVYYVLPPAGTGHGPMAVDEKGLKGLGDGAGRSGRRNLASQPGTPDTDTRPIPNAIGREMKDKDGDGNAALGRSDLQASIDPISARAVELRDGKLITAKEVEDFRRYANLSLHGSNQAFNVDNSSLCLVVSTSNTAAASSQVASYFKTNRIQYLSFDDSVALADGAAPATENLGGRNGSSFGYKTDGTVEQEKLNAGKVVAASGPLAANKGSSFGGGGGGRGGAGISGGGGGGVAAGLAERDDAKPLEKSSVGLRGSDELTVRAKAADVEVNRGMKQTAEPPKAEAIAPGDAPRPAKPGAASEAAKVPAKSEEEAVKSKDALADAMPRPSEPTAKESPVDKSLSKTLGDGAKPQGERELPEQTDPKFYAREPSQLGQAQKDALRYRAAGEFAESTMGRTGVIMARMNRRQANELSEALSRETGQRAQLTTVNLSEAKKDLASEAAGHKSADRATPFGVQRKLDITATAGAATSSTYALGAPATDPVAPANNPQSPLSSTVSDKKSAEANLSARSAVPTTRPAEGLARDYHDERIARRSENESQFQKPSNGNTESSPLNIQPDPMDEPVDVYIFVKDDRTTPVVPSIQQGVLKSAESAPAGEIKK